VALQIGWLLFFGPALQWLADRGWQSAKLLGVFSVNPVAPRMYYHGDWNIVELGLHDHW
jgi:hypothetical protein